MDLLLKYNFTPSWKRGLSNGVDEWEGRGGGGESPGQSDTVPGRSLTPSMTSFLESPRSCSLIRFVLLEKVGSAIGSALTRTLVSVAAFEFGVVCHHG